MNICATKPIGDKDQKDPWRLPDDAPQWLKETSQYHKDIQAGNERKKNERKASQIKYDMEQQKNRAGTGVIGTLLPNRMSGFAQNSNDANVLRT